VGFPDGIGVGSCEGSAVGSSDGALSNCNSSLSAKSKNKMNIMEILENILESFSPNSATCIGSGASKWMSRKLFLVDFVLAFADLLDLLSFRP
jgi:hypothetical protein